MKYGGFIVDALAAKFAGSVGVVGDGIGSGPVVNGEQSRRFAITGQDPEGGSRTIILWRNADYVEGRVVKRAVLTLDATMTTATVLPCKDAVELAQAILAAAK